DLPRPREAVAARRARGGAGGGARGARGGARVRAAAGRGGARARAARSARAAPRARARGHGGRRGGGRRAARGGGSGRRAMSADAEASAPPALVVIDPSPAQRERLLAASDALGVPLTLLEPQALAPGALAALAGARGVLVAWDLGVRAGLDVVEALARDPATASVPVALAVEAPTRVHVELALRAGAD